MTSIGANAIIVLMTVILESEWEVGGGWTYPLLSDVGKS